MSLLALQWLNEGCFAAKLMTMFDNYRQAFDGGISYDIAGGGRKLGEIAYLCKDVINDIGKT